MSADDWIECPICDYKRKNAFYLLKNKYGKIPQKDYEKLKDEIQQDFEPNIESGGKTPVRVDREHSVSDEGIGYVCFSAVCQKCGASWQHKAEFLPEATEDKEIVKEISK